MTSWRLRPLSYHSSYWGYLFSPFQRELLRRPLAEWKTTRAGGGEQGEVAVQRGVDPGVQRSLRSETIHHNSGQVRGNLGQWTPGRLRIRDLRWWRWEQNTVFSALFGPDPNISMVLLRQLPYAIKNQLGHPKPRGLLLASSLWHKDSWLPCTKRIYQGALMMSSASLC